MKRRVRIVERGWRGSPSKRDWSSRCSPFWPARRSCRSARWRCRRCPAAAVHEPSVLSNATALQITATDSTSSGSAPLYVVFHSDLTGGVPPYGANWNFGDGSWGYGLTVNHTYLGAGNFAVGVYGYDAINDSAVTQLSVTVTGGNGSLAVSASAAPTIGPAPLTVDFWANVTGGVAPYTTEWSFGDGGNGTGFVVTHTYAQPGSYTATAFVSDSDSQTTQASAAIEVLNSTNSSRNGSLSVELTAQPTSGSVPLPVTFDYAISGGAAPYQVTFCTGATPSDCSAVVGNLTSETGSLNTTYDTPGNDSPQILVSDSSGHTAVATTFVQVSNSAMLEVKATDSPRIGFVPLVASFAMNISGGTPPYTVQWYFGDGSAGSSVPGASFTHNYTAPGLYAPILYVLDAVGHNVTLVLPVIGVKSLASSISVGGSPGALSGTFGGVSIVTLLALVTAVSLGALAVALISLVRARRARDLKESGELMVRAMTPDAPPAISAGRP